MISTILHGHIVKNFSVMIIFSIFITLVIIPNADGFPPDTIIGISQPQKIISNSLTNQIYVINSNDLIITVIDGSDNSIRKKITFNEQINDLAVDTKNNLLFASTDKKLYAVDTETYVKINLINFNEKGKLGMMSVDSNSHRLYVEHVGTSNKIIVIDTINNESVHEIDISDSIQSMVFNENFGTLYVLDSKGMITKIFTDEFEYKIKKIEILPEESNYGHLLFNPTNNLIYVLSFDEIFTINSETEKLINTVQEDSISLIAILNPNDGLIYASDNILTLNAKPKLETIFVIDPTSGNILYNIEVGNYIRGLTMNPKTNLIYVSNYGFDSISIIDANSKSLVSSIVSYRLEIGIGISLFIISLIAGYGFKKRSSIDLKLIWVGTGTVGGFLFSWLIYFWDIQFPNLRIFENFELLFSYTVTLLYLIPLSFSIIFTIYFFVKYKKIRDLLSMLFLKLPINGIEWICKLDKKIIKTKTITHFVSLISFILLAMVITSISVIILVIFPMNFIISYLPEPFSNLFNLPVEEIESKGIYYIHEGLGKNNLIISGIGTFWIFILRQINKYNTINEAKKIRGSSSMLIFLYVAILLIVIPHITNLSINEFSTDKLIRPLNEILAIVISLSIGMTIFVYVLEQLIIKKLWCLKTKHEIEK